jgi:hypothetical protein
LTLTLLQLQQEFFFVEFTYSYNKDIDDEYGWKNSKEIKRFNKIVYHNGVSALLACHFHHIVGYQSNAGECNIPFFRMGSAGVQHYLAAEIDLLALEYDLEIYFFNPNILL